MSPVLSVSNLSFEYTSSRALHDITFSLPHGSVTALVGPNGAGKTTLLRCVAGLDVPMTGSVLFNGIDILESPIEYRRQAAYLPEAFGLYDSMTVKGCLTHFGRAHGLSGQELIIQMARVGETVGISKFMDHRCGELSRGQRQRVGLGLSLIHEPKILLLDEPAANLDPESRAHLSSLIRELSKSTSAIIVSSHILSELEDYCDQMLLMSSGRVLTHTSVAANREKSRAIHITVLSKAEECCTLLSERSDTKDIARKDLTLSFNFSGSDEEQSLLLKALIHEGIPIVSFKDEVRSLEQTYLDQIRNSGETLENRLR